MALTKVGSGVIQDDAVGIANLGATGTASATTFLRGDNAWASASAGFTRLHIPSTGTYTVPTAVTKIIVEVQGGGGGGGGGGSAGYGSGGSAGAYTMKSLSVTAGDEIVVAVGAGGNGGGGGTNGVAGGASTFTDDGGAFTAVSSTGGGMGKFNADPDAGGVSSGGDVQVDGMKGTSASGGNFIGAPSMMGFSGPRLGTGTGAAKDGTGYGAGGTGAYGVTNGLGAAGRAGIVIVWEYK